MFEKQIDFDEFQNPPIMNITSPSQEYAPSSITDKIEVLRKYPLVFKGINISSTHIVPILMHHKETHAMIEKIYNKQHELILKKKSLSVLNLSDVISELIRETVQNSRQHYIQTISNLIYSAEKYSSKQEEFKLFLKFNQAGFDAQQLLFYLFVRQHFKILTYTHFMGHKKTLDDPAEIKVTREQAVEIIKIGFSHDDLVCKLLLTEITQLYKDSSDVNYYEFLIKCTQARLNYKDITLLDKLIALYTIDYEEQLRRSVERTVMKTYTIRKEENGSKEEVPENQNDGFEEEVQLAKANNGVNVMATIDRSMVLEEKEVPKQRKYSLYGSFVGKVNGELPKKVKIAKSELEAFHQAIKNEVPSHTFNLLAEFPVSKKLRPEEAQESLNTIVLSIENKLNFLVDAIFQENSKKFSKLLRVDFQLNKETRQFWEETMKWLTKPELLEEFTDRDVAEFLNKLTDFSVIDNNIRFLVGFRFKTESEIMEFQTKGKQNQ